MTREELVKKFFENLEGLPTGDRAILKRNAGNTLAETRGGSLGLFYKILPFGVRTGEEELWFIIATLRFLNRYAIVDLEGEDTRDFGWTMRNARSSDSFDIRVRGLLDSRWSEGDGVLAHRLRQMVRLAESKNVPVNWRLFLVDLTRWEHPERWVQKKWARSYFGAKEETNDIDKTEEE